MNVLKGCRWSIAVRGWCSAATVAVALLAVGHAAHAAVAVLLEQPYGRLSVVAPAGHSAIYLNHVCAETPLLLRPCRAGELGVVLSRYDGVGDHDWIAIPLIPYLYAVPSAQEIPDQVDHTSELNLREAYRRSYLEPIAADAPDGSAPAGNWYELVGSAFDRTIYGFQLETTAAQDAQLIATFNDQRNTEKYNGMLRNCADFARVTVNLFYPHAVRRNYIADLGMTSPKSVARGVAHYAAKHPQTGFRMFVIPQVKGELPRSHANVTLAEGMLKRYGVPLTVLSPLATGVVVAAYVGHGRFSMPKDAPLLDISEVQTASEIWRPFQMDAPKLPAPIGLTSVGVQPEKAAAGGLSVATGAADKDLVANGSGPGVAGITRVGLIH